MGTAAAGEEGRPFLLGADLSALARVEASGGMFRDDGKPEDIVRILARHGFNAVRLRLWHTPAESLDGLGAALATAGRCREAGFELILDLHYSDTWADPGRQEKPRAWASGKALEDSVYRYTRDAVGAFVRAGAPPGLVQLGNEIVNGMLWDEGRVGGSFDGWDVLSRCLRAGARGVREAAPDARIVIHVPGNRTAVRFFDRLAEEDVPFDVIGLSYYPWWHGSMEDLGAVLRDLRGRYRKDVMVVETAYPWTLEHFDDVHNVVGLGSQLMPGFPASPEGQDAFLKAVVDTVTNVPGGQGVIYWAPEWISVPGFGSPWENAGLFDRSGKLLPAARGLRPMR